MNLCSDGHEEVCFEYRKCPACEAIKEGDDKIKELESEIETANNRISELEEERT